MCELVSSELRTPCGFGLGRGTLFAYEGDIALPISKCKEVLDLFLRGECMAGAAEVLATNFTDFAIAEKVCASDIESVNARCRLELEDIAGALNNEAAKELGF
jgi:D-ribose pyranose/furanose isomerase RbsD